MGTYYVPGHVLGPGDMEVSNIGPRPEEAHCCQGRETQHTSYSNLTNQNKMLEEPEHSGWKEELALVCMLPREGKARY